MESNKRRRLSNLLIKKKLQLRLSGVMGVLLLFLGVALWTINNWAISFVMGGETAQGLVFSGYLAQIKMITLFAGLFIFAVSFLLGLFITHHLAGPIYRFERVFERMEQGDLSMTVHLRKHDEFHDTAAALNRAISGLREKIGPRAD